MNFKYWIWIAIVFLISCNGSKYESTGVGVSDTSVTASNEDGDEQSYADTRQDYESLCSKQVKIDTTFTDGSSIQFILVHYCLNDSLNIPAKYDWSGDNKNYLTHNFASRVAIIENSDTIVNTVIKKEMFASILPDEQQRYGVLLYPNFRSFDPVLKSFKIQYSVSIPLADIGSGVLIEIMKDGKSNVTLD